jgi:hypothetical protein
MVGPVDVGTVDRDPLRAPRAGDDLLGSRAVFEVGPSDGAGGAGPVDVAVGAVDRHPQGVAGGFRARIRDGKPAGRVARLDATQFLLLLTEHFSRGEDEYDLASIPSIFRGLLVPPTRIVSA